VPDGGSSAFVPVRAGLPRAAEMALLGERVPAPKALEWGLVNRVHEDGVLMEEAMKLAAELANGPTVALALIRRLYWDSPENSFEEQLNLEFQSQRVAGNTADFKEGVTAFVAKRAPNWRGR
jgi:2-(1,2-epoxy-1,2-dihydrophenyl)acetyl-CoA isomerase